MFRLPKLIYANKFLPLPLPPLGTFTNTTILITGGTSGLGLATAVHFLSLGASTVIITARTAIKGTAAKSLIEAQTARNHSPNQPTGKVEVRLLNMGTFVGIEKFADTLKKEVESVDYVLLNAGMMNTQFKTGEERYEETLAVNTLGTALLALLLLPWLKVAGRGKAHLAAVSSGRHEGVDISPGKYPQHDILLYHSKEENWPKDSLNVYANSKLLLQYCFNEIGKLAVGPDGKPQVIVNTLCPGAVKSNLGRNHRTSILMSLVVDAFMLIVSKTTEVGARRLVLAATTTQEEHGKYLSDQPDEVHEAAIEKSITGPEGQKMQAQVWKEVLAMLENKVPEVRQIVENA